MDALSLHHNLTFAEHFAGIGLVRLGLEALGWRVLFANHTDEKKHSMYLGYFKDPDGIYEVGALTFDHTGSNVG